jgi:alcohol dehydrogenase
MENATMRAVLTTAHGGADVLQLRHDYPRPGPAPGEVLVRVAATAVNFHDIFTRRGMPREVVGKVLLKP